jgi:hypothetical protein
MNAAAVPTATGLRGTTAALSNRPGRRYDPAGRETLAHVAVIARMTPDCGSSHRDVVCCPVLRGGVGVAGHS